MQVALGVERAAVLGAEVAVGVEDALGRHLVVAAHQRDALHRDLAGEPAAGSGAPVSGSTMRIAMPGQRAAAASAGAARAARRREARGDREGLGETVGARRCRTRPSRCPASFAIGALKSTLRTLRRSRSAADRVLAQRLLLMRPGVHRRRALALDQRERGARLEDLLEQQRRARRERRRRSTSRCRPSRRTDTWCRRGPPASRRRISAKRQLWSTAARWVCSTPFGCAVVPEV